MYQWETQRLTLLNRSPTPNKAILLDNVNPPLKMLKDRVPLRTRRFLSKKTAMLMAILPVKFRADYLKITISLEMKQIKQGSSQQPPKAAPKKERRPEPQHIFQ